MDPCNQVQEKIAGGAPLDGDEQRHAATCPHCASVASTYSLLDATLETFVPALATVPAGFAERVMALIAADDGPPPVRWFERRAVQIVLANAAAICAVFNLARFLARIFVSDIALGGTP
jgi:hypothetical protein